MDSNQIVSRMNKYLHIAANALVEWLNTILPKTSDEWWDECVIEKLSYNQRESAKERGIKKLEDFDLAALLRIADKSWYSISMVEQISNRERECIRDMMHVRNNWAHASAILPGKDQIISDLTTLRLFFEQRKCGNTLISEVDEMIDEVKSPSTIDFASLIGEPEEDVIEDVTDSDDIQVMNQVQVVGDPGVIGIVLNVVDLGDIKKFEVFVNGDCKVFYSGQIRIKQDKPAYHWVDINTFRNYLTAYQINNPSSNDLYSLNSARIDFVPYQFRPALKIIHSDEPRILIADSVGVGKTIEAGLIIKELQARHELENILIICPKPLVTEKKWETEMLRFDEGFSPVDGPTLRQIISETDRDGAWPVRHSRSIIPFSILDSRTYLGEQKKRGHSYGLVDLDPAPHFDLVIIDEAHHIRNGSMEKEKAFEYKCVKYFCDHADAVVMLTATPLQTSSKDLFTLLNVLRPDIVIDEATFSLMSKPNVYVSKAAKAIRRAEGNWQKKALDALRKVLDTQWGENVIAANPDYKELVRRLQQKTVLRDERVRLISYTEGLHSFNSLLNRTRRKDIQDFCVRRPFTLAVDFTPEQKALHDELLDFEHKALLLLHGSARSISFMMSMIKRQSASCIFGLAPHMRELINRRFQQLENDDYDTDSPNVVFPKEAIKILEKLAWQLIDKAENLPKEDPKFDQVLQAIREKQKQENNKIIIFSTFRDTLAYLKKKLRAEGLRVEQIDGSVKDGIRQEMHELFELSKEKKNAIDILLFTEVGSEGLDYQKCNMMINYDLPWNPMRIEQRIGRIDRRGQESDVVSIYNVITNGTVDADIYYRCLLRIGIFEHSIGECDEILGDIAEQLDKIAFDYTLTDEERKLKLEQMADNEVRRLQELTRLEEEEKDLFGIDISEYMTSQEIDRADNAWLTPKSLQKLVEGYLTERIGSGEYILGESDIKQIRLSADARLKIRDDFRKLPGSRSHMRHNWEDYLKGRNPMHAITFEAEAAEKNKNSFFITPMHPLAKQAAAFFDSNEKAYIRLHYVSDELPQGKYLFSVYAWNYVGMNPHFKMKVFCEDERIASELPDIINESQSSDKENKINPADWESLERDQIRLWSREKKKELQEAKSIYNYKTETLTNNYRNQKRSLEQKMRDYPNEKLRRMYLGQMDAALEAYEMKMAEINAKIEQTDIHTTLIANGILDVINP